MSGHVAVGAGRSPRAGAEPVSGASPTGATSRVRLGDGVERLQHRRADGGAAADRERVDRVDERLAVGRRRDGQLREAREDDEAHPDALRLVLDELARRLLRDGQPVGLDVGRAHRPGDVEGEDDRRPRVRRRCARRAGEPAATASATRLAAAGRREGAAASASASAAASAAGRRSSSERPACAGAAASTGTPRGARATTSSDEQRERPGERHLRSPARTTRARGRSRARAGARRPPRTGRSPRGAS